MRGVLEIERVGHARIEVEEVQRQQVVERIPASANDLGVRKERLDQANVQEVVGSLVGNKPLGARLHRQSLEIEAAPLRDGRGIGALYRLGILRNPADERRDKVELATRGDGRMGAENLFNEGRA